MVEARRAIADDAPELVRLRQVMLVAVEGLDPNRDEWQPAALAALRTRLTDRDGSFVAFVVDAPDTAGRLAACAIGLVERRLIGPSNLTGEIGYILNVVTDAGHRRRGYSRACMEALLGWYQQRGVARIDLRASAEGEPLYRALGFIHPPLPTMQLTMLSEVSGVEGGWHAHPDAIVDHANVVPAKSGRVVGLGAICDLSPQRVHDERDQNFSVSEFVTLDGGRRVVLHEERGFTIGLRSSDGSDPGDIRDHETLESLTRDVLNVVLPDDDEPAEDHPWSWLADLARARGLNVTAEDLRVLPYEVIFTDNVRRWLAPA